MKFSTKSILLTTSLLPTSVGFIAAVEVCAYAVADWVYRVFFPATGVLWEETLSLALRNTLVIGNSSTFDSVAIWIACVPGWIALACINMLLCWSRRAYCVLLCAIIIFMMPFYGMLCIYDSPDVILILGRKEAYLTGTLPHVFGACLSLVAVGLLKLYDVGRGKSEQRAATISTELSLPSIVLLTSCYLGFSMYGWWLLR